MRKIIGAGRIVHPDPEVARSKGWRYGLPLEAALDVDLSHIASSSAIGELGRLCVEVPWRNKGAVAALFTSMCEESLRNGVEYWISAANTSTDRSDDAEIVAQLIERRGLMRRDIAATLREPQVPRVASRFRFYSDEERRRASEGEVDKLRLPPVIALDARLGARYFGPVVFDSHFGMYAMPLIASVREVQRDVERLLRASR